MHSVLEMGVNSVPAFLTKIWTLVEDHETDELISWDTSGLSFHVHDQGRFSKEILPHYFKHSNFASFVRQLNMYGFRKVVHMDSGSIKKDSDDVEFHHPYFIRGQENLLEHIKRKTSQVTPTNNSTLKTEGGLKFSHDDVTRVLNDVQLLKGKQEAFTSKMDKMKKENEALWREVATLRQKHGKQQQIVNKLIQFMIHLVGGNRNPLGGGGLPKRKMPLMISDSSQVPTAKRPRYSKQLSIEEVPDPQMDYLIKTPGSLESESSEQGTYTMGPIIQEVTENVAPPSAMSQSTSTAHTVPVKNMAMKLPTKTAAEIPLPSTMDLPSDLNTSLSSTDLNDLVQTMDDSILNATNSDDASNTNTEETGALDILDKNQLTNQLDTLQFEIDNLKDMMSGEQFNLDLSAILPMLNTDGNTLPVSVENLLGDLEPVPSQVPTPSSSGNIIGNELIQYQSPADIGIPDLSDIIGIDPLTNPEEETEADIEPIDPMSFINTVPLSSQGDDSVLNTPLIDG